MEPNVMDILRGMTAERLHDLARSIIDSCTRRFAGSEDEDTYVRRFVHDAVAGARGDDEDRLQELLETDRLEDSSIKDDQSSTSERKPPAVKVRLDEAKTTTIASSSTDDSNNKRKRNCSEDADSPRIKSSDSPTTPASKRVRLGIAPEGGNPVSITESSGSPFTPTSNRAHLNLESTSTPPEPVAIGVATAHEQQRTPTHRNPINRRQIGAVVTDQRYEDLDLIRSIRSIPYRPVQSNINNGTGSDTSSTLSDPPPSSPPSNADETETDVWLGGRPEGEG